MIIITIFRLSISIFKDLKEFLLLNIFEGIHELTISLLGYNRDPLCDQVLLEKFFKIYSDIPLRNVGCGSFNSEHSLRNSRQVLRRLFFSRY